MRRVVIGGWLMASLVVATFVAAVLPSVGLAQRPATPSLSGSGLIALAATGAEGRQQVTVIDPETRAVCVYHIDSSSGEITLKSIRNIHWDLQMDVFNGASPLPREIRSLLEKR